MDVNSYNKHPYFIGYAHTSGGRIYDYIRDVFIASTMQKTGFEMVRLMDAFTGKIIKYSTHKFVYECMTDELVTKYQHILHIDGNKSNNVFSNLKLTFDKKRGQTKKFTYEYGTYKRHPHYKKFQEIY